MANLAVGLANLAVGLANLAVGFLFFYCNLIFIILIFLAIVARQCLHRNAQKQKIQSEVGLDAAARSLNGGLADDVFPDRSALLGTESCGKLRVALIFNINW